MVLDVIASHARATDDSGLDVIDFGCAEGAMLAEIAAHLGPRFGSGLGLDVFRGGVPPDDIVRQIRFRATDLFRDYPYPVADASYDIAIASAFLKHHPDPGRFLSEMSRVLRTGGCALLLDPRPFVVRIGSLFGRFNPGYIPSLWSRATVERLLTEREIGLRLLNYRRYWVAPSYALYRLGLERILPRFIGHAIALHQCLVLAK